MLYDYFKNNNRKNSFIKNTLNKNIMKYGLRNW